MAKDTSMKVSVDRAAPKMRPGIHYFVVPFRFMAQWLGYS